MVIAFLAILSFSQLNGVALAAGKPHINKSVVPPPSHACEPYDDADITVQQSQFVSNDVDHIIRNATSNIIDQTITTSATTTVSATFSAEVSGEANFIFSKASVKLGVSLTGSVSIFVGTSTSIHAEPMKVTHIRHGAQQLTLWVHTYSININCQEYNDRYGQVIAPEQQDIWDVWTTSL